MRGAGAVMAVVVVWAVGVMTTGTSAATDVHPAGVRSAIGAGAVYPAATLSGSYTVKYSASGDVPDADGSGTTFATESYSYTVGVDDLPVDPHDNSDASSGFDGTGADFHEPTADPQPTRYERLTDVHFTSNDPDSNGSCSGFSIEPTGAAVPEGGLDAGLTWTRDRAAGVVPGSSMTGTTIDIPATSTYWTQPGDACQTDQIEVLLSPVAHEDQVSMLAEKGGEPSLLNLAEWSFASDTGRGDGGSYLQQLFTDAPEQSCSGGIPSDRRSVSGHCTLTNADRASNATMQASLSWSFRTSGLPTFHERILSGDHQTLRPGAFAGRHLRVQVLFPNGRHTWGGDVVHVRVTGAVKNDDPYTVTTNGQGIAVLENIQGKPHQTGPGTVTVTTDNAEKPVVFHLRVRR